jgi:hypothetical protein
MKNAVFLSVTCSINCSLIFFHSDDEGSTFLRYVGSYNSHTASYPRRWHFSQEKECQFLTKVTRTFY